MLKIIDRTKVWFTISAILILIGIGFGIARGGLNFGIDFRGGTEVTIDFGKAVNKTEVDQIVKKYSPNAVTNTLENTQLEIKAKTNELDSAKVQSIMKDLKDKYKLADKALKSQDEIGASVGEQLTKNAVKALLIAIVGMLVYVIIRFRYEYAIAAVIALIHDVLITLAVYSVFNVPVNSAFIAGILTIIGYSMNDTVVIFDRIRENEKNKKSLGVAEVANLSVNQTLTRSINTSMTILIAITSVFIFVPTIRDFTFPLMIGIFSGAYSSIFIASPIWVIIRKRKQVANK